MHGAGVAPPPLVTVVGMHTHRSVCLRALALVAVTVIAYLAAPAATADPSPTRRAAPAPVYTGPTTRPWDDVARAVAAARWYTWAADSDRWYAWAVAHPPPVVHGSSSYAGAKACVAHVENHDSYARGDNPTHTGRYQFSYDTWVANGGDPATWENASPTEQDAVFEATWNSPGGPNNWLPYDPC